MRRLLKRLCTVPVATLILAGSSCAQRVLTWQEIRERFEAANPILRAGQIGVDESKAQEITAFLRPNPNFALSTDGTQLARYHGVCSHSPVLSFQRILAICTNGNTKGSCVWKANRRPRELRFLAGRILKEL
jgi:hypothetical protein